MLQLIVKRYTKFRVFPKIKIGNLISNKYTTYSKQNARDCINNFSTLRISQKL